MKEYRLVRTPVESGEVTYDGWSSDIPTIRWMRQYAARRNGDICRLATYTIQERDATAKE